MKSAPAIVNIKIIENIRTMWNVIKEWVKKNSRELLSEAMLSELKHAHIFSVPFEASCNNVEIFEEDFLKKMNLLKNIVQSTIHFISRGTSLGYLKILKE